MDKKFVFLCMKKSSFKLKEGRSINCDIIQSLSIEISSAKSKSIIYNTIYIPPNEMTLKKLKSPIKHINTFLISFLTFMAIRSQNRKLKSNSRAIRALGLLKGIAKSSKKKQRKILKNRNPRNEET